MPPRRGIAAVLGLVLSAAALAAATSPAVADGGDANRGGCSGDSSWRVRVFVNDDSRLTAVGVVFSDDTDLWSWRLLHNDDLSDRGEVRARDDDRSVRISRDMINFNGSDDVVWRAENESTGEICRGEVIF